MSLEIQAAKANDFLQQHHMGRLLILPNIWDALSAKMVVAAGFKSVATASIATAIANGYADGEQIPFPELMKVVGRIVKAVDVPVTVDLERGFATSVEDLKERIDALLDQGAVGLNIEDSLPGYSGLVAVSAMQRRIEAIREAGIKYGVPLVINARTDIFIIRQDGYHVAQAIERAKAYQQTGADCIYPILIRDYADIETLVKSVRIPVNVALVKPVAALKKLEETGVARVSLGPGLFNYALTKIKTLSERLKAYDSAALFGEELMTHDALRALV